MKQVAAIAISLLFIVLSACGQQFTKEEVVNKAFESSITSFNSELSSNVEFHANGQKMNQSFDFTMTYIEEPFYTHLNMKSVQGDVELYIGKESTYILPPNTESWIKTPTASVKEFSALASGDSIKKELDRLKKFADLFKLKQIENGYVLEVNINNSSSDKEKELVQDVLQEGAMNTEIEVKKINKFDYTLTLDKDFLLKHIDSTADIEVEINGDQSTVVTDIEAVYSNVNNVKAASIPDEITESAVER